MPGGLNLSSQPASEVLHCDWTCSWGHKHHSLLSRAVWAFWSLIWPLEILWQVLIDLDNHLWERRREQWTIPGPALLQNFTRPGPDLPSNLTNSSASRKSWQFNLEREQRMRSTRLFLCILPWVVEGGQNSSNSERLVTSTAVASWGQEEHVIQAFFDCCSWKFSEYYPGPVIRQPLSSSTLL